MNINVLSAFSEILTFYSLITRLRFISTSSSRSLLNLRITHLLWMGSMILEDRLQLRTNRVVSEQFDMIMRRACWAPSVRLSAQSRMMIFVMPFGRLICLFANDLMVSLTTSIPRSSEALSSFTAFLWSPSSSLTIDNTLDVLPVPGGPVKMRCGMFPCWTQALRVLRGSVFPNTSLNFLGRYFSNQISFMARNYKPQPPTPHLCPSQYPHSNQSLLSVLQIPPMLSVLQNTLA